MRMAYAIRFLICALLGFSFSVVTAWLAAILCDNETVLGQTYELRDARGVWRVTISSSCASTKIASGWEVDPQPDRQWRGSDPSRVMPYWAHMPNPLDDTSDLSRFMYRNVNCVLIDGFGWPFRSLVREAEMSDAWGHPLVLRYFGLESTWPNQNVVLPLRPTMPGFVLNALLYMTMCCLLWHLGAVMRRRIRRSAHRCDLCGYDLRSSCEVGCPECGWNRPPNEGQRPAEAPSPVEPTSTAPSSSTPPSVAPSPCVPSESTGSGNTPASS